MTIVQITYTKKFGTSPPGSAPEQTDNVFKIIHNYVDIFIQPLIFMPNVSNTRGNTFRFIQLLYTSY